RAAVRLGRVGAVGAGADAAGAQTPAARRGGGTEPRDRPAHVRDPGGPPTGADHDRVVRGRGVPQLHSAVEEPIRRPHLRRSVVQWWYRPSCRGETMTETMTPQGDTFHTETMSWVTEPADLAHLVATLAAASTIVYDLETTGLDEHAYTHGPTNGGVSARVVLASFTIPVYDDTGELEGEPSTYVVPLTHPESPWRGQWRKQLTVIAEAMQRSGALLIGHNVKFDHRWIYA